MILKVGKKLWFVLESRGYQLRFYLTPPQKSSGEGRALCYRPELSGFTSAENVKDISTSKSKQTKFKFVMKILQEKEDYLVILTLWPLEKKESNKRV